MVVVVTVVVAVVVMVVALLAGPLGDWGDDRAGADVDECLEQLDDCDPDEEVCRNTAGAYDCEALPERLCDRGYRLDATTKLCRGEFIAETLSVRLISIFDNLT